MKAFALVLCFTQCLSSAEEIREFRELTVGTNTYKNVTVRKRDALDAVVKFQGGLTITKIADLPEPLRSEWLDEKAAEKLALEKSEKASADAAATAKLGAARTAYIAENFVMVGNALVPKTSLETIRGEVVEVNGATITIEQERSVGIFKSNANSLQRIGAAGGSREKIGERIVHDRFTIHNAPPGLREGQTVSIKAVKTAKGYDCGVPILGAHKPVRQPDRKKVSGN